MIRGFTPCAFLMKPVSSLSLNSLNAEMHFPLRDIFLCAIRPSALTFNHKE